MIERIVLSQSDIQLLRSVQPVARSLCQQVGEMAPCLSVHVCVSDPQIDQPGAVVQPAIVRHVWPLQQIASIQVQRLLICSHRVIGTHRFHVVQELQEPMYVTLDYCWVESVYGMLLFERSDGIAVDVGNRSLECAATAIAQFSNTVIAHVLVFILAPEAIAQHRGLYTCRILDTEKDDKLHRRFVLDSLSIKQ